ncbi:MAG: S9 family peptidase [bacterium]|nr:S9 family peptidase [bacterium]
MGRGGLYALPGIRGGGEYGDDWANAGKRRNKPVGIGDMIATGEWLCEAGYTSPDLLVADGGSVSGILAATVSMQRPDLFAAALIEVPKLDMLRYHEFTGSTFSVPDFGSSENADDDEVLRAYSLYHNVEPGVEYPAMLVTVGEEDGTCPRPWRSCTAHSASEGATAEGRSQSAGDWNGPISGSAGYIRAGSTPAIQYSRPSEHAP